MHNFTQYILEVRKKFESTPLTDKEMTDYMAAVSKTISKDVQNLLFLTQKYTLYEIDQLENIKKLSKSSLKKYSDSLNIPLGDLEDIWNGLTSMKDNELRVLPQYQSAQEREGILQKKLRVSDLTIDLESDKGKRAVVLMYTPLINKIVNGFVGKSKLDRAELMSAALTGFNDAINDWDPNNETQVSFKTYASYRVRQQILNDINEYGHSLSGTNWYAAKKAKSGDIKLDAVSIDNMHTIDSDREGNRSSDFLRSTSSSIDRWGALGVEDKDRDDSAHWKKVFDAIENRFKVRDVDIFYRYFGLNGRKKEKSKDIAKSYGMSEGNIRNSVINKILAFLRSDKELLSILQDIQDIYNEGLMVDLFHLDREQIIESLLNDDTFILLEEINRWNREDVFNDALLSAFEDMKKNDINVIKSILSGSFDDVDETYRKNKKIIIAFLSNIYPTESFTRKSDVELIDRMVELQDAWKKFNK